jgi:hypothetical protein
MTLGFDGHAPLVPLDSRVTLPPKQAFSKQHMIMKQPFNLNFKQPFN